MRASVGLGNFGRIFFIKLRNISLVLNNYNISKQVSCYDTNLSLLLEKALQSASIQPERITKLKVCIFKEDHHHPTPHAAPGQRGGELGDSVSMHRFVPYCFFLPASLIESKRKLRSSWYSISSDLIPLFSPVDLHEVAVPISVMLV